MNEGQQDAIVVIGALQSELDVLKGHIRRLEALSVALKTDFDQELRVLHTIMQRSMTSGGVFYLDPWGPRAQNALRATVTEQ